MYPRFSTDGLFMTGEDPILQKGSNPYSAAQGEIHDRDFQVMKQAGVTHIRTSGYAAPQQHTAGYAHANSTIHLLLGLELMIIRTSSTKQRRILSK